MSRFNRLPIARMLMAVVAITMAMSLLPAPASAEGFTNADLRGRKAFRHTHGADVRWTETTDQLGCSAFSHGPGCTDVSNNTRGALTFDGQGGVRGFRMTWGWTSTPRPSTLAVMQPVPLEDHRGVPLRQDLVGTYTVSPDGMVAMTLEVSPVHDLLGAHHWLLHHTVQAVETVQAVLAEGGHLDGFFTRHYRGQFPPDFGAEGELALALSMSFETVGGCDQEPVVSFREPSPPAIRPSR